MADNMLCTKNVVIVVAIILVLGCLFYYTNNKEKYNPNSMIPQPVDNQGDLRVMENSMSPYMTPTDPNLLQDESPEQQTDTQFARGFFFGGDPDRYDYLFNDPENVLNQMSQPVQMAPNVDLPMGAGPDAYNAQRHEYRRLRRRLGLHRGLADLPPTDLFGSTPQESLFVNHATGRPLQLTTNNVTDHEDGVLARLDRIRARRDFDNGDVTLPYVVPSSGRELPYGAPMASFDPASATLQLHDPNEITVPSAGYDQDTYNAPQTLMY